MSSRVMALGCRSETMPFDYRMARTLKGEGHAVLDGLRVLHAIHAFREAAASFRPLTAAERGSFREFRLRLVAARGGETLAQLLARGEPGMEHEAVLELNYEYNVTPWLCSRTSRAFFGRAALVASRIPSSLRCRSASRSEPRAPHLSAHSEQPSLTERLDIGVGGSDPGILRVHPHDRPPCIRASRRHRRRTVRRCCSHGSRAGAHRRRDRGPARTLVGVRATDRLRTARPSRNRCGRPRAPPPPPLSPRRRRSPAHLGVVPALPGGPRVARRAAVP